MYGMKCWTLIDTLLRKLEAFEMWVHRRILRIRRLDRIRNEDVLHRVNKDLEIVILITVQKLHLATQGKIDVRRGFGRRRTSWLRKLKQWFNLTN